MPKSLVEKLCEVFAGMDKVLKEGQNGEYSYLRILDISNAVREKLFAAGVSIIPSDQSCEIAKRESAISDREWTEATVCTEFTIVDGCSTPIRLSAYGFARDLDAKCVAIAQTAALKSFLKRMCLIFGDRDDPERDELLEHSLDLNEGEKEWGFDIREWPISRGEVIAFNSACAASGYSKKGIATYLDANFGVDVPSKLRRKYLPQAMAWACATGEKIETANEPA